MSEIQERIKEFIVETFLFGNDTSITNETSFIDEGVVDSTGVLELITFLEEAFSLKVSDNELIPENLDSINSVAKFVQNKIT